MKVKLISWNVNSIRARLQHIKKLIADVQPEIICLQETKVSNELFPKEFFLESGFKHFYINGIPSYNGVCIISKLNASSSNSINWCSLKDGRHIMATWEEFDIHCFYVPAGGEIPDPNKNSKFKHKLDFLTELKEWSLREKPKKTIICGDFNVAPREIDVWSHKQLANVISHTFIERKSLKEFKESNSWVDIIEEKIFPPKHPFTWWSYRAKNHLISNKGRRLDHVWASNDLRFKEVSVKIVSETRGWERPSDHVPVLIEFII